MIGMTGDIGVSDLTCLTATELEKNRRRIFNTSLILCSVFGVRLVTDRWARIVDF